MSIVASAALGISLSIVWSPGYLCTSFNDNSWVQWDYTQPPTTAVWFSTWDSRGGSLPARYQTLQVVGDGSKYTWTFNYGSPAFSFSMPAGPATLGQVMAAIYQATLKPVTASEYQSATGFQYAGSTPDRITVGQTIIDNLGQWSCAVSFTGLSIVSPGVIVIEA